MSWGNTQVRERRNRELSGAATSRAVIAGCALLAGVLLGAVPLVRYAEVGGAAVRPAGGIPAVLVGWIWPAALLAAGGVGAAGRRPRFVAGVVGASAALAVGLGVGTTYWFTDVRHHAATELISGRWLVTSSIQVGPGIVLTLAGCAVLVLGAVVAVRAARGGPEGDPTGFEALRPAATGAATLAGFVAVVAVGAAPLSVPDLVVTAPSGFQTVIGVDGPASILARTGLDRLGVLLLAAGVLVAALTGATLRERFGAVGVFVGLAAYFTSTGPGLLLAAGTSPTLGIGFGAALQTVAAVGFAGIALWCATARPPAPAAGVPGDPEAPPGRG